MTAQSTLPKLNKLAVKYVAKPGVLSASCRSVAAGIGGQDRNGKVAKLIWDLPKWLKKHNDFKTILEQWRAIQNKTANSCG
jgi:hypothetical protein